MLLLPPNTEYELDVHNMPSHKVKVTEVSDNKGLIALNDRGRITTLS